MNIMRIIIIFSVILFSLLSSIYGQTDTDILNEIETKESIEDASLKVPDISVGTIYDFKTNNLLPTWQIEIYDEDIGRLPIKSDIILAEDRFAVSAGWKVVAIIDISVYGFWGYNIDNHGGTYGIGISILKW